MSHPAPFLRRDRISSTSLAKVVCFSSPKFFQKRFVNPVHSWVSPDSNLKLSDSFLPSCSNNVSHELKLSALASHSSECSSIILRSKGMNSIPIGVNREGADTPVIPQRFIQNRTVAVQLKQAIKGLGDSGKPRYDACSLPSSPDGVIVLV